MFYVFPKALKPDVCDEIIKDCKSRPFDKGLIVESGKEDSNPNVRKTLVNFIEGKDNKVNELVWRFIREANRLMFNYNLEYFQPAQFAEYRDGGFYDWHQDSAREASSIRKLSLTLNLSDPNTFDGGGLQFFNGEKPMVDMGEIKGEQVEYDMKSQGTVIVFDSRDWHRVWPPITKGVRHSIVCWTVGPNYK